MSPPDPELEAKRKRTGEWLYKRLADLARPEPLMIEQADEPRETTLRPIAPADGWPR